MIPPSLENYDFKKIEKIITAFWNQKKFKKPSNNKKIISILLPPPNITGELHLGHAFNNFIQDALVRFYRLQGYETVWIPGMDHAGIATEIMVKKWIKENNWTIKNKQDFKDYFNKWFLIKKTQILKQWKKMGLMLNYDLFAFTLDDHFQQAVKKAFVDLYNSGFIYQDQRLVNFDLKLQTAISDIEINHKKQTGKLYYVKYWTTDLKSFVVVATTRPETIFADQALVIHPNDKRYLDLLKQKFLNPLTNSKLPLLISERVDHKFGTGVLKCTPGHDFTDFQIAKKYDLKIITCFNQEGFLKEWTGEFKGLDRLLSRPKIIEKLKKTNHLLKTETIQHNLPFSDRTNTLIEPYLSKQWFIKTRLWSETMLKKKDEIHFFPKKYHQFFLNWMRDCKDWCISRQLTWGHRLPVYFDSQNQIKVSIEPPQNKKWKQSEDVLDTWFSSGLWSLINFGWNNPVKKKLKSYLPINYLVTSYDIIFFWIARMLFLHQHFLKQIPFQKILIHGLIRTSTNEKMSKSRQNSIKPEALIEEFGVDSLRFYFLTNHKMGEDCKLQKSKLIQSNQFCNKLWNINIFIEKNKIIIDNFKPQDCINELNYYICKEFSLVWKDFLIAWEKNLWSLAFDLLTRFIWKDFSNKYLKLAKTQLQNSKDLFETKQTINFIWQKCLIFLHPVLPFLTEFLWKKYYPKNSILEINIDLNQKPIFFPSRNLSIFNSFQEILQKFENLHFSFKQKLELHLYTNKIAFYEKNLKQINQWLKAYRLEIRKISFAKKFEILFLNQEKKEFQIKKEIAFYQKELARSEKILANDMFLKKAKANIIALEKEKKLKYEKLLFKLLAKIKT